MRFIVHRFYFFKKMQFEDAKPFDLGFIYAKILNTNSCTRTLEVRFFKVTISN